MTLVELLELTNSAYPDGYLAVYYDSHGRKRAGSGDTLAQFIVTELIETSTRRRRKNVSWRTRSLRWNGRVRTSTA